MTKKVVAVESGDVDVHFFLSFFSFVFYVVSAFIDIALDLVLPLEGGSGSGG